MLHKQNYPKAENLTKRLMYPSVVQKNKNSWLIYLHFVCKQKKNQHIYSSVEKG